MLRQQLLPGAAPTLWLTVGSECLSQERKKKNVTCFGWNSMANNLATCHTCAGRAINLTIVLVFCSCTDRLGWEEPGPGRRKWGLLQIVYSVDPVLSLAAFTSLSLKVTQSRYASRLQHLRIVLLARRASWKPLNISPGMSLANILVRRCWVLCCVWPGCSGYWLKWQL